MRRPVRTLISAACCFSTACTTWQPANPSQLDGMHAVRIEMSNDARVRFDRARLRGDSIIGETGQPPHATGIAVAEVKRVEQRELSAPRTIGLVAGTVGVFLAAVLFTLAIALSTPT